MVENASKQSAVKIKEKASRASVSAEVYGQFNKKTDYKPKVFIFYLIMIIMQFFLKVIPKNENQKERIKQKLALSFMFSALDLKEQEIVMNAFEEKIFKLKN